LKEFPEFPLSLSFSNGEEVMVHDLLELVVKVEDFDPNFYAHDSGARVTDVLGRTVSLQINAMEPELLTCNNDRLRCAVTARPYELRYDSGRTVRFSSVWTLLRHMSDVNTDDQGRCGDFVVTDGTGAPIRLLAMDSRLHEIYKPV
jgi:hypothetical protein